MSEAWKIFWLSVLTIAMWLIGYICGRLEGYDEDVNNLRKLDLSSDPDRVRRALDVVPRKKGK